MNGCATSSLASAILFPDAAANEARFWRNIISGKLSTVQIIGVIVYVGAVAALTWVTAKEMISSVVVDISWRMRCGVPAATLEGSESTCRGTQATAYCGIVSTD
jgi:hypothetical protein